MLSGKRAAVFRDERRRIVQEAPVLLDSLRRIEIERDARVNATLAEMTIECPL